MTLVLPLLQAGFMRSLHFFSLGRLVIWICLLFALLKVILSLHMIRTSSLVPYYLYLRIKASRSTTYFCL